jgi:hypothetical protein
MLLNQFEVKTVRSESELTLLYNTEIEEYGADSIIRFENLLAFWRQYPQGVFCLFCGNHIVGGIGIWPIYINTFQNLVQGRLDEKDLNGNHVLAHDSLYPLECWYIGDIILAKQHRQTKDGCAGLLLEGSIRARLTNSRLASQVSICALVYSRQGKSLSRKIGLIFCAKSPDGHDVYMRRCSPCQIQKDLEKISATLVATKASRMSVGR